jgi:predicted nucleic acid-binding protein
VLPSGNPGSSRFGVSFADAIHLATALIHRADAVLTNDEAWRDVPEAPSVFLVDELAADFE